MDILNSLIQNGTTTFLVLVFASVVMFVFAIASMTSTWWGVRRRAGQVMAVAGPAGDFAGGLRAPAPSILDGLLPKDEKEKSELRKFLNFAGYYGTMAPAIYQLIRIVLSLWFGMLGGFVFGMFFPNLPFFVAIIVAIVMALLGFMFPRSVVAIQRDRLCEEHRQGFPDFLDLLVICVEAGIGIDSAIERVGADLANNYPSLSKNLGFMSLEMRAGRSTKDALANLADRLGIDEARSFATLIQQSEELGSSLVQSLRVYSDEMRAKRLARAEEKAHALPVKLVLPLGLFIFPVILGVTMLPVILKIYKALGI